MAPGNTPAGREVVETPAGLIVPAHAVQPDADQEPAPDQAQAPVPVKWPDTVATDPDGRRRIVLTRDDRRTINRAIRRLNDAGLGIVVGCRGICGQFLVNEGTDAEGKRDVDSGYGCQCSRVWFV